MARRRAQGERAAAIGASGPLMWEVVARGGRTRRRARWQRAARHQGARAEIGGAKRQAWPEHVPQGGRCRRAGGWPQRVRVGQRAALQSGGLGRTGGVTLGGRRPCPWVGREAWRRAAVLAEGGQAGGVAAAGDVRRRCRRRGGRRQRQRRDAGRRGSGRPPGSRLRGRPAAERPKGGRAGSGVHNGWRAGGARRSWRHQSVGTKGGGRHEAGGGEGALGSFAPAPVVGPADNALVFRLARGMLVASQRLTQQFVQRETRPQSPLVSQDVFRNMTTSHVALDGVVAHDESVATGSSTQSGAVPGYSQACLVPQTWSPQQAWSLYSGAVPGWGER